MNMTLHNLVWRIKPLHALAIAIMYDGSIFFYKKKYKELGLEKRFAELKGSKAGKRCFIIGNGPSLTASDLDKLVQEDCFASNYIYKIFDQTAWRPKYYILKDRHLNVPTEAVDSLDVETIFIGDYYWRFHNTFKRKDLICIHEHAVEEDGIKVSEDISRYLCTGFTVSFAHMQIAAYMGYKEIYLLGFDHSYASELQKDGSIKKKASLETHFYKGGTANETTAYIQGITRAYEVFRDYAREHGITVKNVTRGGKLEIFERADFDSLFDGGKKP